MRRNMKTGIKVFLRNFFDRFSKTSYRQDLQAILKFLKVTGCYYCYCYYAVLCDLNRVIPNFVAFIVVLLRWYCLVFLLFFFLNFSEETFASRRKKFLP